MVCCPSHRCGPAPSPSWQRWPDESLVADESENGNDPVGERRKGAQLRGVMRRCLWPQRQRSCQPHAHVHPFECFLVLEYGLRLSAHRTRGRILLLLGRLRRTWAKGAAAPADAAQPIATVRRPGAPPTLRSTLRGCRCRSEGPYRWRVRLRLARGPVRGRCRRSPPRPTGTGKWSSRRRNPSVRCGGTMTSARCPAQAGALARRSPKRQCGSQGLRRRVPFGVPHVSDRKRDRSASAKRRRPRRRAPRGR